MEETKNKGGKIVLLIFLLVCSALGIAAFTMSFTKKCGEGFKEDTPDWCYNIDGKLGCNPSEICANYNYITGNPAPKTPAEGYKGLCSQKLGKPCYSTNWTPSPSTGGYLLPRDYRANGLLLVEDEYANDYGITEDRGTCNQNKYGVQQNWTDPVSGEKSPLTCQVIEGQGGMSTDKIGNINSPSFWPESTSIMGRCLPTVINRCKGCPSPSCVTKYVTEDYWGLNPKWYNNEDEDWNCNVPNSIPMYDCPLSCGRNPNPN